jgi:hypothetical protein
LIPPVGSNQPLKHCRRCSRLVSGRAGFDSSQGHHTVIASEAKQSRAGCTVSRPTGLLRRFAPRNDEGEFVRSDNALIAALAHSAEHRAGISEVRGSKPRRSISSPPIAPPQTGKRWGRPGSPIGRGASFRRKALGVRILLGTPNSARVRKSAKRVGSNPTVWRFDFSREHQFSAIGRSSPTGRGSGPKPRSVQDRSLPAAPTLCPSACGRHPMKALSSEEERRSYKPKVEIS